MIKYLVLLKLLSLSPVLSASAKTSCYTMDAVACEVFFRTNEARAAAGLPALTYCPSCFAMAQEHSEDMATRGYFSHERPGLGEKDTEGGESFSQRVRRFGLERGVGENIARGGGAADTVARWLRSPGHRRNILNPKFRKLAVGYRDGFYTQVFSYE